MAKGNELLETETILPDDYPVHPLFVYIADMKLVRCPLEGTVGQWKKTEEIKEIRRCEIFGHSGVRLGDMLKHKKKGGE